MATVNFTTGPASLPDIGKCAYNGCTFSPLFETQITSTFVKDAANRTVKEIEYQITVDGYVTLPAGEINVENTLATLERLLSAPAGGLVYVGHSIEILVNLAGGDSDVAWGPMPEVLEITPLGGGRSAKIRWTVKTRIAPRVPRSSARTNPVLQFCYDTAVSYDEVGYSTVHVSGITEVPMTRQTQASRTVLQTADDFRDRFPGTLLDTVDMTKFRVVSREFKTSKDKRTLEFTVQLEELPWMALPPDITVARGQFSFRPAKVGVGLCTWLCTLTVTYSVPKLKVTPAGPVPQERRLAWFAFLALLRVRMQEGNIHGTVPAPTGNQNPGFFAAAVLNGTTVSGAAGLQWWRAALARQAVANARNRKVWLVDFSGNEGLYLDSKTVTFSATWRLNTVFSAILRASGLWKKVGEQTENQWALSVGSISGYTSWLRNRVNPADDAIVDFGF